MGLSFPCVTTDGLEVNIVSKVNFEGVDILTDEQGDKYVMYNAMPGTVVKLDPAESGLVGYAAKVAATDPTDVLGGTDPEPAEAAPETGDSPAPASDEAADEEDDQEPAPVA